MGAVRATLLKLYGSLAKSKLDYRCITFGSASKSYLYMTDPKHNQGLRFALETLRTSVGSLYMEAAKPSLYSNCLQKATNSNIEYQQVYNDVSKEYSNLAVLLYQTTFVTCNVFPMFH